MFVKSHPYHKTVTSLALYLPSHGSYRNEHLHAEGGCLKEPGQGPQSFSAPRGPCIPWLLQIGGAASFFQVVL